MPDVTGNTLLMAVQAVNDAIKALEERLKEPGADSLDDTEMLMGYSKAADELRGAYEIARMTSNNLPSYDELVSDDGESPA